MAFWRSPEILALRNARRRASIARMKAGEGFIYVAIVGEYIKIGFSLNPERRVRALGDPGEPARLLGFFPGTWAQEKALHRMLNGHPSRNEVYKRAILTQKILPEHERVAA